MAQLFDGALDNFRSIFDRLLRHWEHVLSVLLDTSQRFNAGHRRRRNFQTVYRAVRAEKSRSLPTRRTLMEDQHGPAMALLCCISQGLGKRRCTTRGDGWGPFAPCTDPGETIWGVHGTELLDGRRGKRIGSRKSNNGRSNGVTFSAITRAPVIRHMPQSCGMG